MMVVGALLAGFLLAAAVCTAFYDLGRWTAEKHMVWRIVRGDWDNLLEQEATHRAVQRALRRVESEGYWHEEDRTYLWHDIEVAKLPSLATQRFARPKKG